MKKPKELQKQLMKKQDISVSDSTSNLHAQLTMAKANGNTKLVKMLKAIIECLEARDKAA